MATSQKSATNILYLLAALVIIFAGVKVAQPLIVPFLLTLFISMLCIPFFLKLQSWKIPDILSVIIIILLLVIVSGLFIWLFGSVVDNFIQDLPDYQQKLQEKTKSVLALFGNYGIDIQQKKIWQYFDPSSVMQVLSNFLTGLGQVLANILLIFLAVIFVLLEVSHFPQKLRALDNAKETAERWRKILLQTNQYVVIKTMISVLTGVCVTVWLYIIGVDHAMLWGLIAFLLNYIPNIGGLLAAIPPALLGFIDQGWLGLILVSIGFGLINFILDNFVQPRLMGKSLGLSTLVVFISLIIWGWLLGPVGMLLSAPITMIFKIILETNERTQWLAIWLSNDVSKSD